MSHVPGSHVQYLIPDVSRADVSFVTGREPSRVAPLESDAEESRFTARGRVPAGHVRYLIPDVAVLAMAFGGS
jgi:hypothetical protein